jgi:myo-inositol-1(or 4)-monophosphatase
VRTPSAHERTVHPDGPELLALAERAARLAGALVRDERPADLGVAATKTSPTDVVTEMDRRSEALLHQVLLDARPDDGILGEEGASIPGTSGLTWVVDPIDGTVNYLYGIPVYAVSVAVVTGDPSVPGGYEVVAGCVHNPERDETFTALAGAGSWRDGQPLRAGEVADLGQVLVSTGFGYEAGRRARQAEIAAQVLPRVRDLRRIGSAALDLCDVAAGRVDAYYERGLNPWDLAAGGLVALEAGALITGLGRAPAGPDLVIAAAPGVHAALHAVLAPLRPDADAL